MSGRLLFVIHGKNAINPVGLVTTQQISEKVCHVSEHSATRTATEGANDIDVNGVCVYELPLGHLPLGRVVLVQNIHRLLRCSRCDNSIARPKERVLHLSPIFPETQPSSHPNIAGTGLKTLCKVQELRIEPLRQLWHVKWMAWSQSEVNRAGVINRRADNRDLLVILLPLR